MVASPSGGGLPVTRPSSPSRERTGSMGFISCGAGAARQKVTRAERVMDVVNFIFAGLMLN